MRNFTKKEMKVLAEYEEFLNTAANFGFKHYTSNEANDKVADIYSAAGGVFHRNWTCGHCLMQMWKGAGMLYFQTKEKMEKTKKNEVCDK